MKVLVNTKELLHVLKAVVTIAIKNSMKVLNCCRLNAYDNCLEIATTDLDVQFVCNVKCDVSECGVRIVNAKALHDFVKAKSKCESILFESNYSDYIKVSAGGASITISCCDVTEYPDTFDVDGNLSGITVKSDNFLKAIKRTEKSVSKDYSRPDFCGFMIKESGNDLDVVTTDGHRLSMDRCRIESKKDDLLKREMMKQYSNSNGAIVLDAKLVKIVEICNDCDELSIYTKPIVMADRYPGKIFIKGGNFTVWQFIEISDLDYNSIINTSNYKKYESLIDKKDLMDAIKNIAPAANKKINEIGVKLNDNNIELFTTGIEKTNYDQTETCKIERLDGNVNLKFGVNYKYLLDAVSVMDDSVKLTIIDEESPIFITNVCNTRCIQVMMPMYL